jgi:hypothetical protein
MLALDVGALARTVANIQDKRKKLDLEVNRQYRQKVLAMFKDVLQVSPQYSGEFVSNWDVVVGTEGLKTFRAWPAKGDKTVRDAGDATAVNYAYTRAKFALQHVTYRTPVYFVNASPLELESPFVTGNGAIEHLRNPSVISAWQNITAYLKDFHGAAS